MVNNTQYNTSLLHLFVAFSRNAIIKLDEQEVKFASILLEQK